MGILKRQAIQKNLLVPDFNRIAPYANDPLDEILGSVLRIDEDNDITPLWFTDGDQIFSDKRDFDAINKFVHQNMITNQKGWLHGTGRNFKGLNNKGPDKKGDQNGNDDRLCIFYKFRFRFYHSEIPYE
jgi:hypothetical protein